MALLLVQITAVLVTAMLCGWMARKLGQAKVIGEIIAGILIGPSVFGRAAPLVSARLFPEHSFALLEVLSTVGLVLFMFLIGSEFDYVHLRRQRQTAVVASATSILCPMILAAVVAPPLYFRFAAVDGNRAAFVVFVCISMSITAFPVLVRILEERGLQRTSLGTTALLCAAANDLFAWMLLPVAMMLVPHPSSAMSIVQRLVWLCVYLATMLGVVRPLGTWLIKHSAINANSYGFLGTAIALVFVSSAVTEGLGVHPLFGAFIAGVCLPRSEDMRLAVRKRLHAFVSVILLPIFFALTGMRTRLDLLNTSTIWIWTAVILVVAIAGKLGGTTLAARLTGQSWRDALALGALLNTRGLVELIVLNIAYNAHVFSQMLFTMLAVMALVTTMMTTPILGLLGIGESAGGTINTLSAQAAKDKTRQKDVSLAT